MIGLGNASLDLQSLVDDLQAGALLSYKLPFKLGNGRGVIEAGAGTTFLLQFRDAELNPAQMRKLKFSDQLCHDLPALWLLKYKKTMFHGGFTDSRSVRANVTFFLAPIYDAKFIKQQESVIADIREYLLTFEHRGTRFRLTVLLLREANQSSSRTALSATVLTERAVTIRTGSSPLMKLVRIPRWRRSMQRLTWITTDRAGCIARPVLTASRTIC